MKGRALGATREFARLLFLVWPDKQVTRADEVEQGAGKGENRG